MILREITAFWRPKNVLPSLIILIYRTHDTIPMKKTMILVIDRDNDFGDKAGVVSPVIGYEGCSKAAMALGVSDPEDSDTNGLFGALRLYNEMLPERGKENLEVVLICGDRKVGRVSDEVIITQLEDVLLKVKPDNAYLVSDGAEDEYLGPIIRSHVPIDHVEKVIVQQAPGVETMLYIFKRIMDDPTKRARFLGPISYVFIIISLIYILSNMVHMESLDTFLSVSIPPIALFAVGTILAIYSYNLGDRFSTFVNSWIDRVRRGSIMFVFFVTSILICVVGFVVGLFSLNEVYIERTTQSVIVFLTYSVWFFIFACMIYVFGAILDGYQKSKKLKYTMITILLNYIAVGLIINGILDYLMDYVGIFSNGYLSYVLEIAAGFALAVVASMLHTKVRKVYRSSVADTEASTDEVY